MDATTLFLYLIAVAAVMVTPGPTMLLALSNGATRPTRVAACGIAGAALADLILIGAVGCGLGALLQASEHLFSAIKWIGAAYLLYLAWKLWTAPASRVAVEDGDTKRHGWQAFLGGLALTISNPKAILFFLALLPTVVDLASINAWSFLEISAAICVLMPIILGTYAFLAARARELFTSAKSVRRLNRSSGVAMAGVAVVIATR